MLPENVSQECIQQNQFDWWQLAFSKQLLPFNWLAFLSTMFICTPVVAQVGPKHSRCSVIQAQFPAAFLLAYLGVGPKISLWESDRFEFDFHRLGFVWSYQGWSLLHFGRRYFLMLKKRVVQIVRHTKKFQNTTKTKKIYSVSSIDSVTYFGHYGCMMLVKRETLVWYLVVCLSLVRFHQHHECWRQGTHIALNQRSIKNA